MFKLIVSHRKITTVYYNYKYVSLDEVTNHVNKLDLTVYQIRIETVR